MKKGRVISAAAGIITAAVLIQGCEPAAPAPAGGLAPGLGSSFDAQDSSGDIYRVTLVKLIDPARPAGVPGTNPERGYRFVAAVFTVHALKGVPRDENAAADAVIIGSDGYQYSSLHEPVAGYTNFGFGLIHVAKGATVTWAVLFEVSQGATVTSIGWTGGGLKGTSRWHVAR